MTSTSYTAQQKTLSVLWMAERHRGIANQKTFFTTYRLPAPSRPTIIPWYRSYGDGGSHSRRKGTERPEIGKEKQNQIEEMLQVDSRRSLREVGLSLGCIIQPIDAFLARSLRCFLTASRLENYLQKQTRMIVLLLLSYTRRTCRRILISCSASFSPTNAVSRPRVLYTSKTAKSGDPRAQELFMSHRRALQR